MSSTLNIYAIALGPFAAVAACVVILLALREQRWREHAEVVAFVKAVGGEYDVAPGDERASPFGGQWNPPRIAEIRVGNRLRMRTGRPGTAGPIAGSFLDDEKLRTLSRARHLQRLDISYSGVGDAAVPFLSELPHLREVYLDGTGVTDDSVPTLSKMAQLQVIGIHDTSITPRGIERLREALPHADVLTDYYQARSRP